MKPAPGRTTASEYVGRRCRRRPLSALRGSVLTLEARGGQTLLLLLLLLLRATGAGRARAAVRARAQQVVQDVYDGVDAAFWSALRVLERRV